ncbi:MAG: N-acetylglucosamine-6-phosphate deacetylase [Actinomycetota bacterium]
MISTVTAPTGGTGALPASGRPGLRLDATDLVVGPGLIDLQINGGYGIDLATEPERLWELGRLLAATGVTAFLPTIVSSPIDRIEAARTALADRPPDHRGAEPLGLHLEGPLLATTRRGAHHPDHLRSIDPELVGRWSAATGVALVTLAPELPGALDAIATLDRHGVVVAGGHTDADAAQAAAATDAGMGLVTHLFNAMAPLGHRAPNLVGYVLGSGRLRAGLIVDGVHIDPLVVAMVWRVLGPERTVLVTDAVAAMGLDPGRHRLGRTTITTDGVAVRTATGTLAGSTLTMDRAIRELQTMTGAGLADAVTAASATPAAVLDDESRGHLRPGRRADLTLFTTDGVVAATVVGGDVVYLADGHQDRLNPAA